MAGSTCREAVSFPYSVGFATAASANSERFNFAANQANTAAKLTACVKIAYAYM